MADSPEFYSPALEELPAPELFELAEQVEALQAHPAWGKLCDLLEAGKANLSRVLIHTVHEHASYAHKAGFLAGMEQMPSAAQAVLAVASRRRQSIQEDSRRVAELDASAERI